MNDDARKPDHNVDAPLGVEDDFKASTVVALVLLVLVAVSVRWSV